MNYLYFLLISLFCLIISYIFVIVAIFVPSILYSQEEKNFLQSSIRKSLLDLGRSRGSSFTAKEIDKIISLGRLRDKSISLDAEEVIILFSAVSNRDMSKISAEIIKLRYDLLMSACNRIDEKIFSAKSSRRVFNSVRREIFKYRIKRFVVGVYLFGKYPLSIFLDRCGRYVTATAISCTLIGYLIWNLNGMNQIDSAVSLLEISVSLLSYGALASVFLAFTIEFSIQFAYIIKHAKRVKRKRFYRFVALIPLASILFIISSVLLRVNYIEKFISIVNTMYIFNVKSFMYQLVFLVATYFVIRSCYRSWNLRLSPLSWKITWVAGSLFMIFLSLGVIFDYSKMTSQGSLIQLFLIAAAELIVVFALVFRNIEIFIFYKRYKLKVDPWGWLSLVSLILIVVLSAAGIWGLHQIEAMGETNYYIGPEFQSRFIFNTLIVFIGIIPIPFLFIFFLICQGIFISRNNDLYGEVLKSNFILKDEYFVNPKIFKLNVFEALGEI